jgi:hypothetical protein
LNYFDDEKCEQFVAWEDINGPGSLVRKLEPIYGNCLTKHFDDKCSCQLEMFNVMGGLLADFGDNDFCSVTFS